MDQITQVPLKDIRPSKTNPRKRLDEKAHAELTSSIMQHGLISPVLVRILDGRPNTYELVNGHRRLAAFKELGRTEIDALVRELTDEEVREIQIIDNLQRLDIHPLDEAECLKEMAQALHLDTKQIAAKVGKSTTYVAQRMKLNDLHAEWQKRYVEGGIQLGHALLLCRQSEADQEKLLRHSYIGLETVGELAEQIEREFHLVLHKAGFPKKDPLLLPSAGACDSCPKRTIFNIDLFGESKSDRCTDASCFEQKADLFLDRQREKIKIMATGGEAIAELTEENSFNSRYRVAGRPIPRNLWARGKDDDWKLRGGKRDVKEKGLIIDGPERGKIVEFVFCEDIKESSEGEPGVRNARRRRKRRRKIARNSWIASLTSWRLLSLRRRRRNSLWPISATSQISSPAMAFSKLHWVSKANGCRLSTTIRPRRRTASGAFSTLSPSDGRSIAMPKSRSRNAGELTSRAFARR